MNFNVTQIGWMDIDGLTTQPIDKERLAKQDVDYEGESQFCLDIRTDSEVWIEVFMHERLKTDEPLVSFSIPDETWKMFVDAVNCVDRMRDHTL